MKQTKNRAVEIAQTVMSSDDVKNCLHYVDRAVENGRAYILGNLASCFPNVLEPEDKSDIRGCLIMTDGTDTIEQWVDEPARQEVLQAATERGFVPVGVLTHYRKKQDKGTTSITARTPLPFNSLQLETTARDFLGALSHRYKIYGRIDKDTDKMLDDLVGEMRRNFWEVFTSPDGKSNNGEVNAPADAV